jgi:hypothetical protein
VAVPKRARMLDGRGEGGENRPDPLECRQLASDHSRQRALPGLMRRTSKRRVDKHEATRRIFFRQAQQCGRIGGRAVDNGESGPGASGKPVVSRHQSLNFLCARDAKKDDIARGRHGFGSGDFLCATINNVIQRLAVFMRHHMQRKAPLQDVDDHAVAHVTKTDKADMNSAVRHTCWFPRNRSRRLP